MVDRTAIELLAGWSRESASSLPHLDDGVLPTLVDEALSRVVSFDLSIAFAYPDRSGPLLLFDGLRRRDPSEPMAAYLGGTYLLDPFYLACTAGPTDGIYRIGEVAPDDYAESDYFNSPHVHPCISMESGSLSEEIAFLFRLPGGAMAAYSLMRSNGRPAFADHEIALLRAVEPMVRQALSHHWRHATTGKPEARARARPPRHTEAEAFERFAADRLTFQQRRIVQLILRGHSNLSVGHRLGITEGTVKNHRHAIYERLGIGTQAELFALFVTHILGCEDG